MPIHEHSRTVSRAADNSWVWKVDFVIWLFRRASGARDYARKSKPRRKRGAPGRVECPLHRHARARAVPARDGVNAALARTGHFSTARAHKVRVYAFTSRLKFANREH